MKTGRIIKSLSGVYRVDVNGQMYDTKPRGLFRKNKFSPIVGDVVDFEVENITEGYIHHVHERKNELKRPPVSNVDHLVLVMSAVEPEFSTQLLDRFLVIAHSYHMRPRILVTKRDITSPNMQNTILQTLKVYEKMGYNTQFISVEDHIGEVFTQWGEGLVVLSGQSGVGKSTLLNKYFPELDIETQHISKALNRGRHTTRHVELFERENGFIADTPGFSALDFNHIQKDEVKHYFMEINEYGEQCKFRDCNHINEPKCNVKNEIEKGNIARFRYEHYLQLFKEIANRKERY
ncbi:MULTISPECIES: ribosome small subunit-dependent GTPase A [Staphylococcus]|uniref:Small ribosomal subunit biogenesis GTPase RsgA n=2 Tax=Staphylococcus cohnii TaxID=29382 RepID=A0ABT6IZF1_9STAP|nr:ribosome small subunit-dependent GTPase A [Staphylococcus cohnii]TGP64201.1 ribosome small subunit-dependent GTPase A [bacterium M00.F.Ca.ET.229.01.1.1]TGS40352.1 ribosome small subunit-dependent GTPase A [bacterium M00.F.Ca.ET.180.01.1.1]AYX89619.1 ribosome small subunit-dependent GTPase A [Staphylococcus cohnii]KKI64556.1 Ribosome small subunit-stimulated GTPase EngC [Staphylococcus cohnii subsp. cohnii]MCI2940145.1 ribosome small subunit-dependent GTPase A [Staphylococcus cohnii]